MQNIAEFIRSNVLSSPKKIVSSLFIVTLMLAVPITIQLIGQQQDIRQRASTENLTTPPTITSISETSCTSLTIRWNSAEPSSSVTEQSLAWKMNDGTTNWNTRSVLASSNSYTLSGLDENTQYFFQMGARGSTSQWWWSSIGNKSTSTCDTQQEPTCKNDFATCNSGSECCSGSCTNGVCGAPSQPSCGGWNEACCGGWSGTCNSNLTCQTGYCVYVPTPTTTPTPSKSRIEGNVYKDLNSNGRKDSGEPGFPGVTVSAEISQLSYSDTDTTVNCSSLLGLSLCYNQNLSTGDYVFNNVPNTSSFPINYRILIPQLPEGYVVTQPTDGEYNTTFSSSSTSFEINNRNFGLGIAPTLTPVSDPPTEDPCLQSSGRPNGCDCRSGETGNDQICQSGYCDGDGKCSDHPGTTPVELACDPVKDGVPNASDYAKFVSELRNPTSLDSDCNGNGEIDVYDYTIWLEVLRAYNQSDS